MWPTLHRSTSNYIPSLCSSKWSHLWYGHRFYVKHRIYVHTTNEFITMNKRLLQCSAGIGEFHSKGNISLDLRDISMQHTSSESGAYMYMPAYGQTLVYLILPLGDDMIWDDIKVALFCSNFFVLFLASLQKSQIMWSETTFRAGSFLFLFSVFFLLPSWYRTSIRGCGSSLEGAFFNFLMQTDWSWVAVHGAFFAPSHMLVQCLHTSEVLYYALRQQEQSWWPR